MTTQINLTCNLPEVEVDESGVDPLRAMLVSELLAIGSRWSGETGEGWLLSISPGPDGEEVGLIAGSLE